MKNPKFTDDELNFIETIMDIQTSLCGDKITKICSQYAFTNALDEEYHKKLLSNYLFELGKTQLILKSIRDKLEDYRHGR